MTKGNSYNENVFLACISAILQLQATIVIVLPKWKKKKENQNKKNFNTKTKHFEKTDIFLNSTILYL